MPEPDARVRIGARLRSLRRQRGLTIGQLAAASGLTKGFLSQVERDRSHPSVASLLRVCDVLAVRIGDLFDDQPRQRLVRAHERPRLHFGGTGATDELLTPPADPRLQAIHSVVPPGGRNSEGDTESSVSPSQVNLVHVTHGELVLVLADGEFALRAGDSLTFATTELDGWRNPSDAEPAELIWVISPSSFFAGD